MAGDLHSRWSQAAVDAARARVDGEAATYREAEALEEFLNARIAQLAEDLAPASALLRFIYVTTLARHLLTQPEQIDGPFAALLALAHGLLKLEGVDSGSTLSHLLAELHGLEARRLARSGQVERAVWELLWGERQAQRSRDAGQAHLRLFEQARHRLRLGHAAFAAQAFAAVEVASDGELKRRAGVWRVRALRLGGDPVATRQAIERATKEHGGHAGSLMLLEWESAALEASESGRLEALIRAASKDDPRYTAANLITISLWTKATKSRAYLDKTVKTRTIRRAFAGEIPRGSAEHAALSALEALEDSYDNKIPLEVRLATLGEALEARPRLARVEWELLVLAASARTLARLSQDAMAEFQAAEYGVLSLALSQGSTDDVLNVLKDLVGRSRAA